MKIKLAVVVVAALAVSMSCYAQNCNGGFKEGSTDGRVVSLGVGANAGVGFYFNVQAGHSYSVEVSDVNDSFGVTAQLAVTSGGLCPSADDAGVVHTESMDPQLLPTASNVRVSFIASATQEGQFAVFSGTSSIATTLNFRAVDTTLFSPRWTTVGGYNNYIGVFNTTNQSPPNVVLTFFNTGGAAVSNISGAFPVHSVVFVNTGGLATGQTGYATLTYTAPPGAFAIDSYVINFSSNVGIFQVPFGAKYLQH